MSSLPEPGEIFSGCKILAQCGRGAYGVVYLACNPLGQKVIIKIVVSPHGTSRELKGLRNYMAVSGKHPNLLQIFHIGELDDGFYYIMEAADNCSEDENNYLPATLGNLFRQKTRFSPERAIAITRELLCGLKVMHQSQLIHRDIKPDNIIFVDGKAKLSDPGLVAEVGQTTTLAGTIGFIPPEVVNDGAVIDQNSDLYALGKVFYCMITGNKPGLYPQLPLDMKVEVCRQLYPALSRMCNRNRSKRFQNADEFLNGLPGEMIPANRWDRCRENFRNWCICNRELWRIIVIVTAVILTAAVILAVKFFAESKEDIPAGDIVSRSELTDEPVVDPDDPPEKQIADFLALLGNRKELLTLQIEAYAPEKLDEFNELFTAFEAACDSENNALAASYSTQLRVLLRNTALSLVPDLPGSAGDLSGGVSASGAVHGFLSSPLAAFAGESKIAYIRRELAVFDEQLYRGYDGFKSGQDHTSAEQDYLPVVFVPPGAVRMPHDGKVVTIPYSYWIGKHEILHENFTLSMGIAPQRSTQPGTPVESVSWNDALFYCYILTVRFQHAGILPPGYIVRIPTEAEWEFAAQNGWLGKDEGDLSDRAVIQENSGGRTQSPGTKAASRLGLLDIYGNVAEMVEPLESPGMDNLVIVRGGSFTSDAQACLLRREQLKYHFQNNDVGFRVVIAPGTMQYFDDKFFLYNVMQARVNGNVYELIGGNFGVFNFDDCNMLSRLAGGRLAEIDTSSDVAGIKRQIPAFGIFPAFTGGVMRDGRWVWQTSGNEVDPALWQTGQTSGNQLTFYDNSWYAVRYYLGAMFLCQWSEAEYENRNSHLTGGGKLPGEVRRFTYGNRRFVQFRSSMLWYAAARFCELLGGRLACLDSPEVMAAARRHLHMPGERILLGGYARRDKWYWLSGSEITSQLIPDTIQTVPSRNRNFVTLCNGRLWNSQFATSFLCEWVDNSDSSR